MGYERITESRISIKEYILSKHKDGVTPITERRLLEEEVWWQETVLNIVVNDYYSST